MPRQRSGAAGRRVIDHPWVARLTRFGYAARGLLYLLMGLLAAQLALAGHLGAHRSPHSLDQQGAIAALSDRPLGGVLLALLAVGLAAYGAWGFLRAFLDPLDKGSDPAGLAQRFAYIVSGISYTLLLWPALRILSGAGATGDDVTASSTEWLLARPFGAAIVAAAGAWLVGVAATQFFEALMAHFRKELRLREAPPRLRRITLLAGRAGYAARGVLFGLIGYYMLAAAFTSGAVKAKGPDRALQDLAAQPVGVLLLALVALGLVCFGLFSALCARWAAIGRPSATHRQRHESDPRDALLPLERSSDTPSLSIAALWALAALLLLVGLLSFSRWAGQQVAAPGDWLALDHAAFLALNAQIDGPLSGFLFTTLNHPGLDYLAITALILGYCARQRPQAVALAAAAIAVALTVNMVATWEVQRSAPRERPFLHIAEARTVIQSCDGPLHVGSRGTDETVAECGAPDAPPGARRGLDWRTILVHYPSFPSGHMRETAALSVLLAAFWPASRLFALGLVLVMGYTRVLYGAHYPSDVLAGTLMGLWSGAVTLACLAAARHGAARMAHVRPVRASWEYVSHVRQRGRPHLDPLPVRLIRASLALLAANGVVIVAGMAGGNAWAENVLELLSDTQKWVAARLPFQPASVAPAITLAGAAALALVAACRRDERWARPARGTVLVLAAAVLLAAQVLWVGSLLFARLEQDAAGGPLAAFPAPHALFAAALVSAMALRSFRLSAPGQALAALTAAVSALAGASTVHAALSGYVCGAACGTLARQLVAQFTVLPGADRAGSSPAERSRAPAGVAAHSVTAVGITAQERVAA